MKSTLFIFFSTLLFHVTFAQVASSASFVLTSEYDLQNQEVIQKIERFYQSGEEGEFLGEDSISIYYKTFKNTESEKAIVVSSGRTEAAIKYKELIYDLYHNGYSIFILDHRGQGQSGRMVEDTQMGYVVDFEDYIKDLKSFYTNQKINTYSKKYLLSHSMGGAIAMRYLEYYSSDFDAAAFSSPMLGLAFPICTITPVLTGDKPKYATSQSSYYTDQDVYNNNKLTRSEVRFNRMVEVFNSNPNYKLGGASFQWVKQSCKIFNTIFEDIEQVGIPIVIFSATHDRIVNTGAHKKFVKKADKLGVNVNLIVIEDAEHELFVELDPERDEVLQTTLSFFMKH